jgi:hypothetical protein
MSAKDSKQQRAKFTALGFTVTRTGHNHYEVRDASGNFLATMGSTPSDRRAVVNVDKKVARTLRLIDQAGAAAAAPEEVIAPARPAEDEAPPPGMTREQRRAVQAEIDRQEALIEAKIRDKGKRKERPARPAPKPLPERVRPKSRRIGSVDDHVTTGPDGRLKVFSGRVMDDGELRRTDIIDAEDFVRNIGSHKQCYNCYQPADFILQYDALSYREARDISLALGHRLKRTESLIREDFRRGAGKVRIRADGEVTGGADVILCRRCYDRAGLETLQPPDRICEVEAGERGLRPADSRRRTCGPEPAATGFTLPPAIAGHGDPLQAGLPDGHLKPPAAKPPVPAAFARRRTPPAASAAFGYDALPGPARLVERGRA